MKGGEIIKKAKVYECEICHQSVSLRGFGTHVKKHGMTADEYWNKYPYPYPEPQGEYGVDYVTCPVCNNQRTFQFLWQHIKIAHNMTIEEFIDKYPDAKIQTTKYSKIQADRCRKGLAKCWADPEYVAKKSQQLKEHPHLKPLTPEQKERHSQAVSARLKEQWKDPEYRSKMTEKMVQQRKDPKMIKAITNGLRNNWVKYESLNNGVLTLKSSWEVLVAEFLDKNNYEYEYEKIYEYYDSLDKRNRNYLADFYLPNYNLVIEVKACWALDSTNVRDKMKGVLKTGTRFMFLTEQDLGCLVSKEKFEELIQSNIK